MVYDRQIGLPLEQTKKLLSKVFWSTGLLCFCLAMISRCQPNDILEIAGRILTIVLGLMSARD
jgi:hypothetical protein